MFDVSAVRRGVAGLVGQTPLVELRRLTRGTGPLVLAKLESQNPARSAKDRPAARMLHAALDSGRIRAGSTVIESSSGNLGVALAQQCLLNDLRFVCVVDPRTNTVTRRLIEAFGGVVVTVGEPDPVTGDWLAARIAEVHRLLGTTPGSWWPNQYANANNSAAHRDGSIREILDVLGEPPTALYVATSSTGTLVGAQDLLTQVCADTRLVAVDAVGSVLFDGARGDRKLPGFGAGIVPGLAERAAPAAVVRVTDVECVVGCRRAVQTEALLVGASAGGVISAFMSEIDRYASTDVVVLLFHDSGDRYLDTVFDDAWVLANLGCDTEELATRMGAQLDAGVA